MSCLVDEEEATGDDGATCDGWLDSSESCVDWRGTALEESLSRVGVLDRGVNGGSSFIGVATDTRRPLDFAATALLLAFPALSLLSVPVLPRFFLPLSIVPLRLSSYGGFPCDC